MAPYSHEFIYGGMDPQILSGFVSAMSSFLGEITGDKHERWKTTYGSEHVFLVESGDWSAGVLAVSRETNEVRSKLRHVVEEFEESFECLKEVDAIEGKLFFEFDHFVRCVFIGDRLSRRSLIIKRPGWDKIRSYERPSIAFKVTKFLRNIKSGQSLGDVAKQTKLSIETTKDLASRAIWSKVVYVKYVPQNEDIISLSERASSVLLHSENPLGLSTITTKVVSILDGRTTLYKFLKTLKIKDIDKVLLELGNLINQGYIQKISIEKRLVLANECIMNELIQKCVTAVGIQAVKESLIAAIENGFSAHPWLGRLRFTDSMSIHCILDDTMTPIDLDQMFESIEFVIQYLIKQMQNFIRKFEVKEMLQTAREVCRRKWSTFLWDVNV
jgi:hypothetical protein